MAQNNNFKKGIDLFSEACARIIKEYTYNHIDEREDGYKVEEREFWNDDNIEYYSYLHTPDGEVVQVDERSIDDIIDYHKKHGKLPASWFGVVQHPDFKPPVLKPRS